MESTEEELEEEDTGEEGSEEWEEEEWQAETHTPQLPLETTLNSFCGSVNFFTVNLKLAVRPKQFFASEARRNEDCPATAILLMSR